MTYRILGPNDPALVALSNRLSTHPEWQAELVILPWAEYQPALESALHANISPYQAVCVPGHVWLPGLIADGLLTAFEPLLEKLPDEVVSSYKVNDLMPSVAAEASFDDQTYLLPLFTDGHLLFFDKEYINLDDGATVSPLGLDALATAAHLPEGMYPLALKAHPSEILLDWLPFLWEAGGEVITANGKPGFDAPSGVEALEYYISLRKFCLPQPENYGNEEIAAVLREGKVAMATSWGGQAAIIFECQRRLGTALYPRPWNATWGISLPTNQPETVQLSMLQSLLFICGPDLDRQVTRIAGSPVRQSSYCSEETSHHPWLNSQHEMLLRAGNLPTDVRLAGFLGDLYVAVYQAFIGQTSPRQALKQAAVKAARVLEV